MALESLKADNEDIPHIDDSTKLRLEELHSLVQFAHRVIKKRSSIAELLPVDDEDEVGEDLMRHKLGLVDQLVVLSAEAGLARDEAEAKRTDPGVQADALEKSTRLKELLTTIGEQYPDLVE